MHKNCHEDFFEAQKKKILKQIIAFFFLNPSCQKYLIRLNKPWSLTSLLPLA